MDGGRRDFLQLVGLGGLVFASGLAGCGGAAAPLAATTTAARRADDFFFLQLSDTHWGFSGPPNPQADVTLKKTIETINAVADKPDFVVFTGDLTHTTDDPKLRRARMAEFAQIVAGLSVKSVRFIPGEHDASLDRGEAYKEFFGELHYAFDHKGIHFVVLDNVSDPAASLGADQLAWLEADLARLPPDVPVVVFAHRPLFELYPDWEWTTKDGAQAIAILQKRKHVTVFYGHIHQEHHHMTGDIAHHAAKSLIFPLPAPGSVPKKAPVPWDPAAPWKGLGYRKIASGPAAELRIAELPVVSSASASTDEAAVRLTAKQWEYSPDVVTVRRGRPVVLELLSLDRRHGFAIPALGIRSDIVPDAITRVRFVPDRAGTYPFHCDVFCGDGHDGMSGKLVVID